jgi:hypothetical protein
VKAVVVYESIFGNTHEVAAAVAEGLAEVADVTVYSVEQATADALAEAELLVVGGPTHAHGMTSSQSRKAGVQTAQKKGEDVDESATGPGLRSWFHDLPKVSGVSGAAFDTRGSGPKVLTGSAAKGIARRLRHHGYDLLAEPESFLVKDAEGPLADGERERARAWGASLAVGA